MRGMICLVLALICLCAVSSNAEEFCGIYVAVDQAEKEMLVIHKNGWTEIYGDWEDLPENTISLGYVSCRVQFEQENESLRLKNGFSFCYGTEPVFNGIPYCKISASPFFPTAAQLADIGLMWQNDQIGDLTFEKDGTVHCSDCEDGTYDNGILEIAGNVYLVQRSVWSDGLSDEFFLTDQVLTLYQLIDNESVDRLLLVQDDEF